MNKEQLQAAENFLHAAAAVLDNAESSLRYAVIQLDDCCKYQCAANELTKARDTLEKADNLSLPEKLAMLETITTALLKQSDVSSTEKVKLNLFLSEAKAREKVYTVMTSLDWLSYCMPEDNAPDARKDVW